MANLNLSQFTEKTFVADADWVFVWDTVGLISKKVSRNSLLNSGTLTTSAPVTISQTWDAGSNVMTALKVVATDTASGTASNLLELWAGSTPALDFAVTKAGAVQAYGTYSSTGDNYARLALACDSSGNATISTQALGTGVAGTISINGQLSVGQTYGISLNTPGVPIYFGAALGTSNSIFIGIETLSTPASTSSGLIQTVLGASSCRGGNYNTAIGAFSLGFNTGNNNTGIGNSALASKTTGASNLAAGDKAGRYIGNGTTSITSVNNSVYLGAETKGLSATGSTNEIVIGYDATGLGSNTAVLGNASITTTALRGNVGIGTTAPSSKLHVAETWNNAGTTFCAIKSVITDTNSAAGSDFLELYSGSATQPLRFDVQKTGQMNIYGAWTDTSNYERLSFSAPTAANAVIGTNKAGTGTARGLELQTDGVSRWTISTAGHLLAATDGQFDIGLSASNNRPRNIWISGTFQSTGNVTVSTTASFIVSNRISIKSFGEGILNISNTVGNNFNILQLGGTVASFPAIKRVGTELQVVIASTAAAINVAADDADMTFIEDRYRRKGTGTPEGVVTAPIGAVYHNTTGGAGTSFYVKESGTDNTGWVAK
jgi:hypothetical protein